MDIGQGEPLELSVNFHMMNAMEIIAVKSENDWIRQ